MMDWVVALGCAVAAVAVAVMLVGGAMLVWYG